MKIEVFVLLSLPPFRQGRKESEERGAGALPAIECDGIASPCDCSSPPTASSSTAAS